MTLYLALQPAVCRRDSEGLTKHYLSHYCCSHRCPELYSSWVAFLHSHASCVTWRPHQTHHSLFEPLFSAPESRWQFFLSLHSFPASWLCMRTVFRLRVLTHYTSTHARRAITHDTSQHTTHHNIRNITKHVRLHKIFPAYRGGSSWPSFMKPACYRHVSLIINNRHLGAGLLGAHDSAHPVILYKI